MPLLLNIYQENVDESEAYWKLLESVSETVTADLRTASALISRLSKCSKLEVAEKGGDAKAKLRALSRHTRFLLVATLQTGAADAALTTLQQLCDSVTQLRALCTEIGAMVPVDSEAEGDGMVPVHAVVRGPYLSFRLHAKV